VAAEAVEVARSCDDPNVLATALARQCWVLLYSGQGPEAEAAILEASALDASIRPDTSALVAAWRAQLATSEGDLGRRRQAYEDAIARYRELGDVRRAATAEVNLADTYNRVGAYDLAERALRESLESNRRLGHRIMEGFAQVNLGYALAMLGRTEEALGILAQAERTAVAVGQPRLGIAARVYRARAILQASPSDEAVNDAESAADEARRAGMPALCASALAMAARARLETGDADMALALSGRAIQLRDELGSLEEDEGEVFLTHACALQANGLGDETEKIVRQGATRLRELAGRIRDLDWRTRFVTDVIANRQLLAMDEALDARR